VVRLKIFQGIRRHWLFSSGPQRTRAAHSGTTKPLIIGLPSFDKCEVY
jgi:hypothetical protein